MKLELIYDFFYVGGMPFFRFRSTNPSSSLRHVNRVPRSIMTTSFTSRRPTLLLSPSSPSSSRSSFSSLMAVGRTVPSQIRANQQPSSSPTATLSLRLPGTAPIHPAARAMQVRYVARDTFNPSHRVRKRRHGFLARNRSKAGRRILTRRRLKGRNTLSH